MRFRLLVTALLAGTCVSPAFAQEAPPAAEAPEADPAEDESLSEEELGEEIVVTGSRPRGSVEGDIPPEITLDARDIRAYGAGSVAELLDALAPQTGSNRGRGGGRPVVLLNGRRISGFGEIRNLPPEAIVRVEILPEEVALKYGYPADQRVVNFVLRRRFRAVTPELEWGFATAGGRPRYEADLNLLRINRDGRWEIDAELNRSAPLFESERNIIEAADGPSDPIVDSLAPFRTLIGESDGMEVSGTLSRTIFGDVSATVNAEFDATQARGFFGLPSATLDVPADSPFARPGEDDVFRYFDFAGPLTRENDSRNARIGVSLNGDVRPWRWSFTGNWDRGTNESWIERGLDATLLQERIAAGDPAVDPYGPLGGEFLVARPSDRSRTANSNLGAEAVLTGPLFDLPAGEVRTTFKAGASARDFHSETFRSGVTQERDLSRDRLNAQANLDLPIASRRRDFLSDVGDLSLNFNAAAEQLSDFGTLRTLGAGLNWSPIDEVRLIASVTDEDGAPSMQQLGDPTLVTPNVRVFDFLRGETVDISRIDGGNPDLVADNRRVLKLGLNVRPLEEKDLSFRADYTKTRIVNPIASFPTATPEIEAAFPERFLRDADGRLVQIDNRPVNFARSDREELRWGVNFSKPISSRRPPRGAFGGGGGRWRERAGQAQQPAGGVPAERQTPAPAEGQAPAPRQGQRQGQREGGQPPASENQQQPREQGAQEQRGPRGGGGGGWGVGRGGFGRGGGGQGGRVQFSLYHTWRFEDSILIRPGVPELDLLGGSATGSRGGRPRHELEAQAGIFKNGLGARLTANWQEGTTVRGGPDGQGGTTGDLRFSSLATVNLRLFANLGEQPKLIRDHPWLRGTRVTLAVNNLFDSRLSVRDEFGTTPLSYQPFYIDPLGRTVTLSLRKLFF